MFDVAGMCCVCVCVLPMLSTNVAVRKVDVGAERGRQKQSLRAPSIPLSRPRLFPFQL